ncbi:uncharacterized protein CG7065-like isoform X3 [Photinus pyralis]|uniref:uncharacterized protein CG7065-like isoform X3 n=1 Tax=Photinus pyralis TaxID=7054 RepID=UPI001267236C|nr:uncharacterized protein CG7065-like isoform X3 [Photinus pyralis]
MEPAAPGTEDEVKFPVQTHASKKETEQERLLAVKARLPNGKLGNVFELSFLNGAEHWYCNLCKCPIMGHVYHHEIGKRHTNNMQAPLSHSSFDDSPLQVAPGEPVPPGVESEIQKVAEIQERLDNFTIGPLIGLEYLFELLEFDRDKEPSYLCLLCDKRGDPRTVIAHLASYNHIIQYIRRHFISCFRAISPYLTKQYKRNWQFAVQKIAEAIEDKFGRLKPHVVDQDTFESKRLHYQNLVACGKHFNERSGYTFEELVDVQQLTKVVADDFPVPHVEVVPEEGPVRNYRKAGVDFGFEIASSKKTKRSPSPPYVAKPKKPKPAKVSTEKRHSLSSVSSISSSDLSDYEPSQLTVKKKETQYRRVPFNNRAKKFERSAARSRSNSPNRFVKREGVHPWQRSDYIRTRADVATDSNKQKTDKLEEFKKLATAIENDMDRILKQHLKNPEKHPQYNEEWKKYWNKRYKELQAEGKNASDYDFKPGWIEFWNKRLLELHHAEVKTKKEGLRKRLGLPDEPAPICFRITGKKKPIKEQSESKVDVPSTIADQDPDVIIIEDKDDETLSSRRSHSPWESESGAHTRKSRDKSRERSRAGDYSRRSRDRSKDYRRSRSRSRDRDWHRQRRSRERDRGYGYDGVHYREPYRKSELPEYIKPPRVMRDVTRHPVMSPPLTRHVEPVEDDDDDEVNIVGVLRLLTAVEEKLGSLGPKVIDLLAQALALEKAEANSAEALLDNEVNCVLFETVKEKLKGQLLAGLVDYNQEKAFKNAIKKIASLIHYAGERKKTIEKEKPKVDPIQVPGVGTVDKAAIAKQIATALVLQGKTDVSQAELEQLINAVVGMAEASRNSNKPVTTASFLQQFSQAAKPPPSESILSLVQPTPTPTETATTTPTTNSMEGLSDLDLQTLLQNFKDLCTDEQHSLISYLKKLEAKEPERVERLRKFVNLDNTDKAPEKEPVEPNPRSSPFANRLMGMNPIIDESIVEPEIKPEPVIEPPVLKVSLDSDDEDYTFEDVFKAAKKNVKEKEERERATSMFKTEDFDLSNAKSLIANIMGQFKASNTASGNKTDNMLGLGKSMLTTPTEDTEKSLPTTDNLFRLLDLPKPTFPIQPRLEPNQPILKVENNPHFPSDSLPFTRTNFMQNVTYPEHNQYMNQPHPTMNQPHSAMNQSRPIMNQPRPHFDQERVTYPIDSINGNSRPYPMRPNYDNFGRW